MQGIQIFGLLKRVFSGSSPENIFATVEFKTKVRGGQGLTSYSFRFPSEEQAILNRHLNNYIGFEFCYQYDEKVQNFTHGLRDTIITSSSLEAMADDINYVTINGQVMEKPELFGTELDVSRQWYEFKLDTHAGLLKCQAWMSDLNDWTPEEGESYTFVLAPTKRPTYDQKTGIPQEFMIKGKPTKKYNLTFTVISVDHADKILQTKEKIEEDFTPAQSSLKNVDQDIANAVASVYGMALNDNKETTASTEFKTAVKSFRDKTRIQKSEPKPEIQEVKTLEEKYKELQEAKSEESRENKRLRSWVDELKRRIETLEEAAAGNPRYLPTFDARRIIEDLEEQIKILKKKKPDINMKETTEKMKDLENEAARHKRRVELLEESNEKLMKEAQDLRKVNAEVKNLEEQIKKISLENEELRNQKQLPKPESIYEQIRIKKLENDSRLLSEIMELMKRFEKP